jgi:hypothetical protein
MDIIASMMYTSAPNLYFAEWNGSIACMGREDDSQYVYGSVPRSNPAPKSKRVHVPKKPQFDGPKIRSITDVYPEAVSFFQALAGLEYGTVIESHTVDLDGVSIISEISFKSNPRSVLRLDDGKH